MPAKQITRTDLSLSTTAAWTDKDVSAYVTLPDVSGIIVRVNTDAAGSGAELDFGLRKNGSTDAINYYIRGETIHYFMVGIDGSNIFEYYIETTGITVEIIGELDGDWVFPTDGVDVTPTATDGTFEDGDLSTWTSTDTAIACFGEIYATGAGTNIVTGSYARKNGGTTDHTQQTKRHIGFAVGCDGSELMECNRSDSNTGVIVKGYLKSGSSDTFNTNPSDYSLSTASSWTALTTQSGAANGFRIIEIYNTETAGHNFGIRATGDSETYTDTINSITWAIVPADSNGDIDGWIDSTNVDFYDHGYLVQATSGTAAKATHLRTMMQNA